MKTIQDQTLCISHVWPLATILLTSFIKSLVLIVSFHVILGVSKILETFFTFSFQMEFNQIVHFNILEYFALEICQIDDPLLPSYSFDT